MCVIAADRQGQAHRRDLLEIMTSFIPLENVKFSKRLTTIGQHPDKVILKFADGEVAKTSVLAGADGIKSGVRKHVLESLYPEQVDPVYADAYCYRAVIPMAEAEEIMGDLTDVAKFFFGYGRSGVSYRITGGKVGTAELRDGRFGNLSNARATIGVQLPALRSRPKPVEAGQRRHGNSLPRRHDERLCKRKYRRALQTAAQQS
jgi:2-polyprenyl-6-methoxyphenol hydroxylase-like FAD-dependent oxidoreductase